jgi:TusA-related sulfurtransferase
LKITQAFREMKNGELMQVNGNDAKTRKEILKVLNTFRYQVIDKEEKDNSYCIWLEKKGCKIASSDKNKTESKGGSYV